MKDRRVPFPKLDQSVVDQYYYNDSSEEEKLKTEKTQKQEKKRVAHCINISYIFYIKLLNPGRNSYIKTM